MPRLEDITKARESLTKIDWLTPLGDWLNEEVAKPRWIITGIIPAGALVLVSGPSKKGGKTWLADTIALSLCCKLNIGPFCVADSYKDKDIVIINIAEEGTRQGEKERLEALIETYAEGDSNIKGINNIYYGHRLGIKLIEPEWQSKLHEAVNQLKPDIIILDTFSDMFSGDENRKNEVQQVVEVVKNLRAKGVTMMVLAHLNKSEQDNPEGDMDRQVRGSGYLTNSYDTHLALRNYNEGAAASVEDRVDLFIRSREGSGMHAVIQWVLEMEEVEDFEKKLKSATLKWEMLDNKNKITPKTPEQIYETHWDNIKFNMLKPITRQRQMKNLICRICKIPSKEAIKVIDYALTQKHLKYDSVSKGYYT
jgi:RecA-family ATPase